MALRSLYSGSGQHRFSLAILFLLITMATIAGALLGAAVRGASQPDWREIASSALVGIIAFGLVGMVLGCFHYRRGIGSCVGLLAGALVGFVAGPLLVVNEQGLQLVLAVEVVGGVLCVVTATALRTLNESGEPGP
jgi:Na+/proline symporter